MEKIAATYTEDVVDYAVAGHNMFVTVFNEDDSVDYLTNTFQAVTATDTFHEVATVIARPGQQVALFDGEKYVATKYI